MANCIRASPCKPYLCVPGLPQSRRQDQPRLPPPCVLPVAFNRPPTACLKVPTRPLSISQQYEPVLKRREYEPVVKHQRRTSVCLLGGEDKPEKNDWGSPFKSLENAFSSFKGKSIEDVLREQIQKQEFADGGQGRNPPLSGGGGGGGGGGRDASGGSGDEGLGGVWDETLQVFLATLGFIFMYIYIISGEELGRLAKDYIKFLFGGSKSVRLKRTMKKWKRFWERMTETKLVDKLWLERAIVNTPTWFDSPEKYRRILRSYLASNSDE